MYVLLKLLGCLLFEPFHRSTPDLLSPSSHSLLHIEDVTATSQGEITQGVGLESQGGRVVPSWGDGNGSTFYQHKTPSGWKFWYAILVDLLTRSDPLQLKTLFFLFG